MSKGKPLTAQEALDRLGPIPLASLHKHSSGELSPIIRDGGIIAKGTVLAVIGPSTREEMVDYYSRAGWIPSWEARQAPYFVRVIAE